MDNKTKSENWKKWRLANKEKWSNYCKQWHANNMEKPEYRERIRGYARKAYEKQMRENPEEYKAKMRESVKNYYYDNREKEKKKKLARYYFNKIKKNHEKYDNDEEMLMDICKGLKSDETFYYVVDHYLEYIDEEC